jgi:NACHT domain
MLKPLPIYFLKKIVREYDLTPEQEEAFVARYSTDEEVGNAEVAKTLNISEGAFRTRMSGVYRKFSFTGNTSGKFYKLRNLLIDRFQPNESSGTTEKEPIEKNDDIDAIVQQVRSAIEPLIREQCGMMRVLDMDQPIELTGDRGIYTNVNILEKQSRLRSERELLEDCDFDNRRVRDRRIPGLKAVERHRRLMVLGKPGAGKTTFLKYLAMQCITGGFAAGQVPFFVTLKDFAEAEKSPSLLEYLAEGLTVETMDQLLSSGRALIFLDGLDEVREEDTKRVRSEILSITRKSVENQCVMTCRIAAQEYTFVNFTDVEVADFDEEQIATFAENWFRAKNDLLSAETFVRRLGANEPIQELAKTPILLTLLCLVFDRDKDFPTKRVDLYEQGIDLLLEDWDKKRDVQRDRIDRNIDLPFIKKLLSYIAFASFTERNLIDYKQLECYIADFIQTLPSDSAYAQLSRIDCETLCKTLVKSLQSHHGILVERAERTYSFSHLTFQEYFTARQITTTNQVDFLVARIAEKQWREVFLLVVGMMRNADELLLAMKSSIDLMIDSDQNLQQFLAWGSDKTRTNAQGFESVVLRACYLGSVGYNPFNGDTEICKGSAISEYNYFEFYCDQTIVSKKSDLPSRNCQLISDLFLTECVKIASGIDAKKAAEIVKEVDRLSRIEDISFDQALSRMSIADLYLDYFLDGFFDYAYSIQRDLLGANIVWNGSLIDIEIEDQFKSLHSMLPTINDDRNCLNWWGVNGEGWIEKFRKTTIECRNIGHDWQFTDDQEALLQQYHDANRLLVECLNSGCCVSPSVREEIEATLLLPVEEIDKLRMQN